MEYMKKLWERDLGEHFRLQFPSEVDALKYLSVATELAGLDTGRKGSIVEKESHVRVGKRPWKCWRCTERHVDGDLVCPMARDDPEQWHRLTRKARGRRNKAHPSSMLKVTKIVFGDD